VLPVTEITGKNKKLISLYQIRQDIDAFVFQAGYPIAVIRAPSPVIPAEAGIHG